MTTQALRHREKIWTNQVYLTASVPRCVEIRLLIS